MWDEAASTFDNESDHGLSDPNIRAAWTTLLKQFLPTAASTVLDVGCGTGSLSLIMAELGHSVTGIDSSEAMLAFAREKAKNHAIIFHLMDAAHPQLTARQFDVIVGRHILWVLPEPEKVLRRWQNLLKPGGQLILIEGFWHTGAGLHAEEIRAMLAPLTSDIVMQDLSQQPELWGKNVNDERYVISARLGK